MSSPSKMNTVDIYKLALSKGLTGKEAAYEYGVRYHTLMMCGYRHKLPPLVPSKHRRNMYRNMSIEQLDNIYATLQKEIQIVLTVKAEKNGTISVI